MGRDPIDYSGKTFGRLIVGAYLGGGAWECQCACGKVTRALGHNLKAGTTKSCGCLHKDRITTHGLSRTRTRAIWKYMMARCYDPKALGYANYGGRGIKVCERWHKLENFYADMGVPPDNMTLDRIENDGDYEKDNCKWSTWKEQHRNRRNNHLVTAFGRAPSR